MPSYWVGGPELWPRTLQLQFMKYVLLLFFIFVLRWLLLQLVDGVCVCFLSIHQAPLHLQRMQSCCKDQRWSSSKSNVVFDLLKVPALRGVKNSLFERQRKLFKLFWIVGQSCGLPFFFFFAVQVILCKTKGWMIYHHCVYSCLVTSLLFSLKHVICHIYSNCGPSVSESVIGQRANNNLMHFSQAFRDFKISNV